jgi:hypothetical protein
MAAAPVNYLRAGGGSNFSDIHVPTTEERWKNVPFNPVHARSPHNYKNLPRSELLTVLHGPGAAPTADAAADPGHFGTRVKMGTPSALHGGRYLAGPDKALVASHAYAMKMAEILAAPTAPGVPGRLAGRMLHIFIPNERTTEVSQRATIDTHDIGGVIASGRKEQWAVLLAYPGLLANIPDVGPEVVDLAQVSFAFSAPQELSCLVSRGADNL